MGKFTSFDDVLYRCTRGKKKKAFLKWLQAIGVSRENRNKFEKWIAQRKGYPPYSYNWYTFKWYAILTSNIKYSEGGTEK